MALQPFIEETIKIGLFIKERFNVYLNILLFSYQSPVFFFRSLDKEKKSKRARVPTLAANKANHMKLSLNEDSCESPSPAGRRSRKKSDSVSTPTITTTTPSLG